jgi:hypothetical protein
MQTQANPQPFVPALVIAKSVVHTAAGYLDATAAYQLQRAAGERFTAHMTRLFGRAAADRRYDATRRGWDKAACDSCDTYHALGELIYDGMMH